VPLSHSQATKTNEKRKTWQLAVINIKDLRELANGEAGKIFLSVGREELGKKVEGKN